jgi:membrane protease subunit (stomatin/prohibitin family)
MSFIKSQLIEVIEWLDDSNAILVYRFPDTDHEIKMGAKLTVRPGQAAVFVNEGQIADVFAPGLYSLSTQNMPILTTLRSWKHGFESPFKAEVYFVNTKQYLDNKWGTKNPITLRDADFGIVRIRAFGTYAVQVNDPRVFFEQVVGTDGRFDLDEIDGQIRSRVVSSFTTSMAKLKVPVLDIAGHYDVIGQESLRAIDEDLRTLGLALRKFIVENISLPPEVEKAIDTRGAMGAIGNLQQFTQFQMANAIPEAAAVQNSMAAQAMGLGTGMAMGNMMAGAMNPGAAPPAAAPTAAVGMPMGGGMAAVAAPQPAAPATPTLEQKLQQLVAAKNAGLLTEEEFNAKKNELLAAF